MSNTEWPSSLMHTWSWMIFWEASTAPPLLLLALSCSLSPIPPLAGWDRPSHISAQQPASQPAAAACSQQQKHLRMRLCRQTFKYTNETKRPRSLCKIFSQDSMWMWDRTVNANITCFRVENACGSKLKFTFVKWWSVLFFWA